MTIPTKNIRTQVGRNADKLRRIDDSGNSNENFKRIFNTALTSPISPRIFQVRSWASPVVIGSDLYDRMGVYNCVEMSIDNRESDNLTYTLTGSPAYSGFEGRMTFKNGVVNKNFQPGNPVASKREDFTEWSNLTSYSSGDLAEITTQYTESSTSEIRKFVNIYKALVDNVNKNPQTNDEEWENLTIEVFDLSEQYAIIGSVSGARSGLGPKLIKYDLIQGFSYTDNSGIGRIAGNDCLGQAKWFHLDVDATTGSSPICNATYGVPKAAPDNAFDVTQEGELGYQVKLTTPGSGSEPIWSDITIPINIMANWINGRWIIPGFYLSFDTSAGLQIASPVSVQVKVDGTTIDFNGSGELEQIP